MPWSERQRLRLRMDSFNVLNHPSFNPPGTVGGTNGSGISGNNTSLSDTSTFGIITSTSSVPRVLQFALRYEF
jgi:hypothetical protein